MNDATSARLSSIAIAGAGQAAAWAAQTLRSSGYAGRLLMFGDEGMYPYERPPLSKAVLLGEAPPDSTRILKPAVFAALNVEFFADDPVVSIDRAARRVSVKSGCNHEFDRLLLCTGGRARSVALDGADLSSVYSLRTVRDAVSLGSALRAAGTVAVVGGGWIGLEVAAAARSRGVEVVVLESQSRLCQRSLPQTVADELRRLHQRAGVEIRLDTQLRLIEAAPRGGVMLRLVDGGSIDADLVVIGVGLQPNDELARACGLAVDQGVVVDRQCRTSDPAIYAAGDVAVAPNSWFGGSLRLESWQNAQNQAIAAARALLGEPVVYDPLPWFWSTQYGTTLEILGFPMRAERELQRVAQRPEAMLRVYLDGNRPVAAIGMNAAREIRTVRRLIEARVAVRDDVLIDPAMDLAKLSKTS
jgi:3-phenylpropionate/trans-cinnamate dioxygenase ferredoxin reductase subunit